MCIKCQFHWTCTLPSTHILYIFRKIYLDFFQKEIPKPNIPKFVLKWDYTNTKYCQIYRGVSDTNTNSTKYTLETPNNPKYKFFMVIWKTKCQALIIFNFSPILSRLIRLLVFFEVFPNVAYTSETPNNPKYKFLMVIWHTKC